MRLVSIPGAPPRADGVAAGPFEIGEFPVTVREFAAFVEATDHVTTAEVEGWAWVHEEGTWHRRPCVTWRDAGHAGAQRPDHPVVIVSRDDAEAYCRWAGGRLPTPEEWLWAAAGVDGRRFPWGEDPAPLAACVAGRPSFATRGRGEAPGRCASPHGCLDLLGNVWEWTSGASRTHAGCGVFVGGGWSDPVASLSTAVRHEDDPPSFRVDDVGFRLVRAHAAA